MPTDGQIESSLLSALSSGSLDFFADGSGAGVACVNVAGARRLGPGPEVACPKSRCPGCEPVTLEPVSFPGYPPGPALRASARSRA